MSAIAAVNEIPAADDPLVLVEQRESSDPADRFGQLVVHLVALANGPVDPMRVTPAALLLRDEHLIDLPDVTFGCNYELDVRSFELDQGYVRAIDAGWLILRGGELRVNPHFALPDLDSNVLARAGDLFALERRDLIRVARHHLLRDADDRAGETA